MRKDNLSRRGLLTVLLLAVALVGSPASAGAADATLIQDAYTSVASPNLNTGSYPSLIVDGAGAKAFLKFDLTNLPAGTKGSDVAKATLRLWANKVAAPGSFDVVLVGSAWNESGLTHSQAPVLGASVLSGVAVGVQQEHNFLTVDVTTVVRGWLDSVPSSGVGVVNHGLALLPSGVSPALSVVFDSKENEQTSNEPQLEIILNGPPGPPGPPGGRLDSRLVATLRWDQAPLAYGDFAAGTNPHGMAFDGANVWVTNHLNATVTKLRARDGVVVGTFAVQTGPAGLAYDGTNVWVTNVTHNTVTKLRASDGQHLGTFFVGGGPQAVAFDGANVWVACVGGVTKLRASDGQHLGTFAVQSMNYGVVFDGVNVWVTSFQTNKVTKLRASDGTLLGAFAVGTEPLGVAFDGTSIWVANTGSNTVSKLRASDGALLGTFAVGYEPTGVAFDGANVWVTNWGSDTVTKLRARDGQTLETVAVNFRPSGVAFDGTSIWVANFHSHSVSKR